MSLKKQLAIIIIVMVSLIASLVVLLVYVMQNREKAVPGVGLLNHTVTETQEPVTLLTESEMKEEIESRDTLPDSLTDTLGDRSMNGLSNGAFTNLDEYLMSLLDNYNPQDSADKINTLRADITYANIIVSEDMEPQDEWHFYNPEVLAAAIAYGSSKQKFDVMIDRNSDLLVAATSNINLRPVVLQQYEASELKSAINSMRSVSIINMAVYDMKIHGYECRFVAVTTDTDPTFQPYSITILNKNPSKHLLEHEHGHSIQNCYYGPLMPFMVNLPSSTRYWYRRIVQKVKPDKKLPPYDSIWFEAEATRLGLTRLHAGSSQENSPV